MTEQWVERFAWYPVRSTWSKKVIWFKRYHVYQFQYTTALKKVVKKKFIYTGNEYLIVILKNSKEDF